MGILAARGDEEVLSRSIIVWLVLTAVPWCHQISALRQIWDLWDAAV